MASTGDTSRDLMRAANSVAEIKGSSDLSINNINAGNALVWSTVILTSADDVVNGIKVLSNPTL